MAWTIEDIEVECKRLSEMVDDTFDCPIRINGRLTRTLGRVMLTRREGLWYVDAMEISKQLLETSTEESIKSVIDHEWCHYFVTKTTYENHGHDKEFKAVCAKVGCDNDGVSTAVNRTVSESSIYKYQVYCETCDEFIAGYSRMNKTLKDLEHCTCKRCGTSKLTYIQNW